ncbi:MAG: MBL fold metallo-hydrolase [Lachnospiraceae bacterium]|nr:MBL fold metallo-hydrolase [Lachnospiraceae bacterium]
MKKRVLQFLPKRLFALMIAAVIVFSAAGCQPGGGEKNATLTPTPSTAPAATGCEVHILAIGKADAIFITVDGKTMLIDAGYPENADTVISYLRSQSVTKLDYVILTHGDRDHVGGMPAVLREFSVGQMLISPKKEKSDQYQEMISIIQSKSIPCVSPEVGTTYELGGATFQVLAPGPKALKEGSDNDASIAIRLVYGARSFLLMGDALSTTEKELVDSSYTIRSDVLKVGHHGKSDATNKKFLKAVQPKYAAICCGETVDGEDGFPANKVIELLTDFHVTTYRTDNDGTIIFRTDGTTLTCNCD